jgi:predicted AAA+ superfamily ATPase
MPARKRTAPEADVVAVEAPSRRRSGRLSSTLQKSKYFEASDDDDASPSMPPKKRGRPSIRKQESEEQYEEEDDADDDDFEDKEEDEEHEQENGVDEDDDSADDEDARPRVKILPLEKMRDTGGVEYQDKTLHKNTLLFLRDLKANNVRSWLKGKYKLLSLPVTLL